MQAFSFIWFKQLQIRSKILLGIGSLFVFGCLMILAFYFALVTTDSSLERIVNQEHPTSESAFEMEVNLVRSGLEVLDFLRTGEDDKREKAFTHKREFEKFLALYNQYASNDEEKEFADRVESLHKVYWEIGNDLVNRRPQQAQSFVVSLEQLEFTTNLINEKIAALGNGSSITTQKQFLLSMKSSLITMGKDMGAYFRLGSVAASDKISDEAEQFLVNLSYYQGLELSKAERIQSNKIANLFEETHKAIKVAVKLHDNSEGNLVRFVSVREQLDNLLSEKMLPIAKNDLRAAMQSAEKASSKVKIFTSLSLPLVIGFSLLIIYFLSKSVTQPAEQLVAGAKALGAGDLDYRIPELGKDELGQIAEQFNVMASRLETTTVSRDKLESSEAALRISEQRYSRAVGGTNDGLFDWDMQEKSVYFSPRWKSMLGYKDSEITDDPETYFRYVHPDDIQVLRQNIALFQMRPGEYLVNEHRVLHKNGHYRWVLFRALASDEEGLGKTTRLSGSQSDIHAQKLAEQQLVHDAMHDKLTGLPNRHLLLERLQHFLDAPKRRKQELCALLFLDLDGFKVVNDTRGHPAGDELLIKLAKRLKKYISQNDTLARFGGDEFVVLAEDVHDLKEVEELASNIQNAMERSFKVGNGESFVSASIGITVSNDSYSKASEMLRDADIAMYRAKADGKKRHVMFNAKMHGSVVKEAELVNDLRHALDRKELEIYYQPIIDLQDSRKLVGFEALLRWHHPTQGLVSPEIFIPLLEETGLIIDVGEWLLKVACHTVKSWHRANYTPWVSVNVSATQLRESGLHSVVKRALSFSKLEPQYLTLEITETNVMQNELLARAILNEVKQLGVKLSMDDFGTGYSSLSYLKRFPWDYVKIDRSFVKDIDANKDDVAIIEAITVMVHSLNFSVVAEGVESAHQLQVLKDYGIDCVQGFLLAKPARAHEWSELDSISSKKFLKEAFDDTEFVNRLA